MQGENTEVVKTHKYLAVNMDKLYMKGQSQLYFLRRLRSSDQLLRTF